MPPIEMVCVGGPLAGCTMPLAYGQTTLEFDHGEEIDWYKPRRIGVTWEAEGALEFFFVNVLVYHDDEAIRLRHEEEMLSLAVLARRCWA